MKVLKQGRYLQQFVQLRGLSTTNVNLMKICMAGAAGGIGQSMSMLLKLSPMVNELNLFDIRDTPGVAADLSHIETPAKVVGYHGLGSIKDAFRSKYLIVTNYIME